MQRQCMILRLEELRARLEIHEGDKITFEFVIPVNTVAEVVLPEWGETWTVRRECITF